MSKLQVQTKRFKMLFLLVQSIDGNVLDKQLEVLSQKIDNGDKDVNAALDYYEDAVISILSY